MESAGKIDVVLTVVLGSLGMLTLAIAVILFVVLYQKRVLSHKLHLQEKEKEYQLNLLNASIEVVEQERKRIAANIHDEVMLDLGGVKIGLTKLQKNPGNTELSEKVLSDSSRILNDSIDTLRKISYDLMPPFLTRYGFIKTIRQICNQVKDSFKIDISFTSNTEDLKFDEKTELQLYRLIKEVINNIVKHTKANTISVDITLKDHWLQTTISHNGKGISMQGVKEFSESGKGIGLKSILSRAQLTSSVIQYVIIGQSEARITIETPVKEFFTLKAAYE